MTIKNWDTERSKFEAELAVHFQRVFNRLNRTGQEWQMIVKSYRLPVVGDATPQYAEIDGLYLQTIWEFWLRCLEAVNDRSRDAFEVEFLKWVLVADSAESIRPETLAALKARRYGDTYSSTPTTRQIAPAYAGWRIAADYEKGRDGT